MNPANPAILAMLAVVAALQGCAGPGAPARDAAVPAQPAKPPSATSVPPASTPAPASSPAGPVPARLGGGPQGGAGASSQCLAQIEAVAERHSGNRVMLGQAAFADSDRLVLTRMPRHAPDGTLADGRAALPAPLVLGLRLGPQGCTIHVVEPGPVGAAAGSTPLPGCTCVGLPG